MKTSSSRNTPAQLALTFFWLAIGAAFAAASIALVLEPNDLIDGGIVGISMISAHLFGNYLLPLLLVILNIPFLILAYRQIGKIFVIQMFISVLMMAGFIQLFHFWKISPFRGEALEVIIVGGFSLGAGIGIIIRKGACLDGTEILAILINKSTGFTVGQVIMSINVIIFALAGIAYGDWHTPVKSIMAYAVASKVMDMIIVGLQETKSVMIIGNHPKEVSRALVHELGLGLTVLYGRGGFSEKQRDILFTIVERLQLSKLKEIVHREDPAAFIAIENLQEVVNGRIRGVSFSGLIRKKKK